MNQVNSLYSPIQLVKDEIRKYCYFDSTLAGEHFKFLTLDYLYKCDNELLIRHISWFFERYIKAFFDADRTKFNKLRCYFMRQVLVTFIEDKQNRLCDSSFYELYATWATKVNLVASLNCQGIYNTLQDEINNCYTSKFYESYTKYQYKTLTTI